jgi:hypothetical protein
MATLYVIPNWERDFENNKSRIIETLTWMPIQNHFDGKRINRIKKLTKPLEKYGAFHVIAAIASRCEYRGVLLDNDGPVGPIEIADKTGFPLKELAAAFEELSTPVIGLLEKHEIVQDENGGWPLPDTVRRWATHRSTRRQTKTRGGNEEPRSAAERREPEPAKTPPRDTARQPAAPSGPASPPSAAERHEVPRREGKGTEVPSAVSLEGRQPAATSSASPPILLTNPQQAKSWICKKILGGKDPARAWSYDADSRLSELCNDKHPMPLQEILDIAWFRSLPNSDDVPELKNRREPVTETGLMNYWGDELQRAREFKKKWRGPNGSLNGAPAKEPAEWREYFYWKYGRDINLPPTWSELESDQKSDYRDGFQTFVNRTPEARQA